MTDQIKAVPLFCDVWDVWNEFEQWELDQWECDDTDNEKPRQVQYECQDQINADLLIAQKVKDLENGPKNWLDIGWLKRNWRFR